MSKQDLNLKIENHIKDLLFNKPQSSTLKNADLNEDETSTLFERGCIVPKKNSIDGKLPLDLEKNFSSSQLIDLNVLTNFAAKHADLTSDSICKSSMVLPHPELENNSLRNSKDGFLSKNNADKSYKVQKNIPQASLEPSNDVDCADDMNLKKQRKVKKPRKQMTKQKTSNMAPDYNTRYSNSKRESYKQEKNKSPSSSLKSTVKRKEKRSEASRLDAFRSPPAKIGFLFEEEDYSLSVVKGNYKLICYICKFEARQRDFIYRHLNSDDHREMKEQNEWDKILPYLPKPFPEQTEIISELILKYHAEYGLQNADLINREKIAARLKEFVESHIKDCYVEMIGSSASGFGLKTSNIDFVFKVKGDNDVPDSLEALYMSLLTEPSVCDVKSDFKKKRPGILFKDVESGLDCNIVIENGFCEKFTRLMSVYRQLDPRVLILGTVFRYWAKICAIDNQDRGTLPAYTYSLFLVYFLQQVSPPVLPVLHEAKEFSNHDFYDECIKGNVWKSENQDSIGDLWIKLFHFYNFTYEKGKHVVCIRSSAKVLCAEKNWSTKFYAIEDPFIRRNIGHVIPNFQVFRYIQLCFLRTYQYFAYPRLKTGQVKILKSAAFEEFLLSQAANTDHLKEDSSDESTISEKEELNSMDEFEDQDPDLPIENVILTLQNMCFSEESAESVEQGSVDDVSNKQSKSLSPQKEPKKNKEKSSKTSEKSSLQTYCSWDIGKRNLSIEDFMYEFDAVIFKGKKDVPYSCRQCKSPNHLKKNCPKDELPKKHELPEMTPEFLMVLNKVLHYIKDKHCVNNLDKKFVKNSMQDIESHIRKLFPEANLSMFGSFCNGFGFKSRSDMDFCLTFKDKSDVKELDCTDIIEKLAQQLQQFPKLTNIVPVTTAKVPIVKFACNESGFEGDISLYNTLAIVNTEMLEAYSKIDIRVQVLGFALKYFAKILGICDASRGSLSSYAYILMVIYFLQQRQPPVIPVLQELHGDEKPSVMIDGWNVWFFRDLDRLPEVWPDCGKNRESVGELWLGLLCFYAYEFDWKEYVVSIKQKAPLTRFRKLWITNQIAIEDPFDLNHNLGAGLSRKMNLYILKAFIRGRQKFGTPITSQEIVSLQGHEVPYLFDRHYLNSGSEPPHDRGCRTCGKIGHIAKNCTLEKRCACCRRTGHIAKNCPYKHKSKKKPRHRDRKSEEKKNIPPQSHPIRNQNDGCLPLDTSYRVADDPRKLMQLGFPSHRHPPPGFAPNYKAPPPGFKAKVPPQLHQNGTVFPHPFNLGAPGQFPPPHYSSSPPKNYQGNKQYHIPPDQGLIRGPRPGRFHEPRMVPTDNATFHRMRPSRSQLPANHLTPQWW